MVPSPAVSLILGVRFLMVLRRIVNGRAQRHTTQFLHLFARRSAGVGFKPCTSTPSHLAPGRRERSEEHTSELQSRLHLVCRLLLEKKKKKKRERDIAHSEKHKHTGHTVQSTRTLRRLD